MKLVHTGDRLVVKKFGGWIPKVAGSIFLLFGSAFLIGLLFNAMNKGEKDAATPSWIFILIGCAFSLVGLGIILWKSEVTIDRARGTVTRINGLLFFINVERKNLDDFRYVTISSETRRTRSSSGNTITYTVYPIRLTRSKRKLNLCEVRNPDNARSIAEEIAKFAGIGVVDKTAEDDIVREAGTLDDSLREKAIKTGKKVELDNPPEDLKSEYNVQKDSVTFVIPPPGLEVLGGVRYAIPAIGCIFILFPLIFFIIFIFATKSHPGYVVLPIIIFGGFGTAGYIFVRNRIIKPLKFPTQVKATLEEISAERKGMKSITIKTGDIEELEITSGRHYNRSVVHMTGPGGMRINLGEFNKLPHILARSDTNRIRFGHGLSYEELDWIRDVIEFVAITPRDTDYR